MYVNNSALPVLYLVYVCSASPTPFQYGVLINVIIKCESQFGFSSLLRRRRLGILSLAISQAPAPAQCPTEASRIDIRLGENRTPPHRIAARLTKFLQCGCYKRGYTRQGYNVRTVLRTGGYTPLGLWGSPLIPERVQPL